MKKHDIGRSIQASREGFPLSLPQVRAQFRVSRWPHCRPNVRRNVGCQESTRTHFRLAFAEHDIAPDPPQLGKSLRHSRTRLMSSEDSVAWEEQDVEINV